MLYSVALVPPPPVASEVKKVKLQLRDRIDWYHSCNSQAHITVCEFEDDGTCLNAWQDKLALFSAAMSSFEVHFDRLEMYSGGGVFLAPERKSAVALNSLMQKLYRRTASMPSWKTGWPHMSIARQLHAFQFAEAKKFFKSDKADLRFQCGEICLRRHNADSQQFEVIKVYPFSGQQLPCNLVGQLALF